MGKIQRWASGKSTCFAVMCETEYFSSLNAIGQQRYMDKLRLPALSLADSPYTVANSINFVKDMSHWPPTDIYGLTECWNLQLITSNYIFAATACIIWACMDANFHTTEYCMRSFI